MKSKKKNHFVGILKVFFIFIFSILLLVLAWLVFSGMNKSSILKVSPKNYSVAIYCDSLWESLSPALDTEAMNIILTEPRFSQAREIFIDFKSSALRDSKLVHNILSRKAFITYYPETSVDGDFIVTLDLSYLSGITRLAFLFGNKLQVPGLSYIKNLEESKIENLKDYFIYNYEGLEFYIKAQKNLLVITNSSKKLLEGFYQDNLEFYSDEDKKNIFTVENNSINVLFNSQKLIDIVLEENFFKDEAISIFSDDSNCKMQIFIDENELKVKSKFPLQLENIKNENLFNLLSAESKKSEFKNKLIKDVEYYTSFNLASLEELKKLAFSFYDNEKKINSLWVTANVLCKSLLDISLNDLFFSWSGEEFSLLGISGTKEPVIAVEIKDEKKRREVFKTLFSSSFISTDDDFELNGINLPLIEFPWFVKNILSVFKIDLPHPHFLVDDNYIYFCESAQTLLKINDQIKAQNLLSYSDDYIEISSSTNSKSFLDIYYNLEKNVPFFLQGNSTIKKILNLYNLGLLKISSTGSELLLNLNAVANKSNHSNLCPGFPIDISDCGDCVLEIENQSNPSSVFWREKNNKIAALNFKSFKYSSYDFISDVYITASKEKSSSGGVLWAVTENGAVYLFNSLLENIAPFPIATGENVILKPVSYNGGLIIPIENGLLLDFKYDGSFEKITLFENANFKSSPDNYKNLLTFYDKSFEGKIYLYKDKQILNKQNPIEIFEIGFGSPASVYYKDELFTGFLSQSGNFYLYKNFILDEKFPLDLKNTFFQNVHFYDGAFYAISEDGFLYKIYLNSSYQKVKISESIDGKKSSLKIVESGKNKGIYISCDSNLIYGFDSELRSLDSFPLAGHGEFVFVDLNGDKKNDFLTLSLDKKLYGWILK